MNAVARWTDPLQARSADGFGPAAVLAGVSHVALIAALALGVQWRSQPAQVVAAELWAAVPQVAAPAPAPQPEPQVEPRPAPKPEPAPPPAPVKAAEPDPQIAIEKRKLEREKARLVQQQAEQAKREQQQRDERERAAADMVKEAKTAKQREENLRRMLGQAGSGAQSGTAAVDAAPSRAYAARLVALIKPNIVFTDSVSANPMAEVEVRVSPSGSVIARRIQKSSGVKEWDEAVLRAIDRTGTLPRDVDGRVPALLIIGFRPND